jgi:hypothetical protein
MNTILEDISYYNKKIKENSDNPLLVERYSDKLQALIAESETIRTQKITQQVSHDITDPDIRTSKNRFLRSLEEAYYMLNLSSVDGIDEVDLKNIEESAEFVAEAFKMMQNAKNIVHEGYFTSRLEFSKLETAFAERWKYENSQTAGINYGLGRLQDLMITSPFSDICSLIKRKTVHHVITPDEARVVATIIQWLGTNVGMSFLDEVFRSCGKRIVEMDRDDHG